MLLLVSCPYRRCYRWRGLLISVLVRKAELAGLYRRNIFALSDAAADVVEQVVEALLLRLLVVALLCMVLWLFLLLLLNGMRSIGWLVTGVMGGLGGSCRFGVVLVALGEECTDTAALVTLRCGGALAFERLGGGGLCSGEGGGGECGRGGLGGSKRGPVGLFAGVNISVIGRESALALFVLVGRNDEA
jgi:hypothetical protein